MFDSYFLDEPRQNRAVSDRLGDVDVLRQIGIVRKFNLRLVSYLLLHSSSPERRVHAKHLRGTPWVGSYYHVGAGFHHGDTPSPVRRINQRRATGSTVSFCPLTEGSLRASQPVGAGVSCPRHIATKRSRAS